MSPELLFPGVYVEEIPSGVRPISGVPTSVAAFLGRVPGSVSSAPVPVTSAAGVQSLFGGSLEGSNLGLALDAFFANGGARALVGPVQDRSPAALEAGLEALAGQHWNLLCLPPEPEDSAAAGGLAGLEAGPVASFCEGRRAFLILDSDPGWTDRFSALAGRSALTFAGRNAALYFPWLTRPGIDRPLPPSGAVAGVYARTDAARGVWKAPAGIDAALRGVSGLSVTLNDAESGELNAAGVCCLRTFPGHGPVVWGARTLGPDPEWKYVPVRRLFLFLEESIDRGTRWAVFEPNEQALWDQLRQSVEDFLHSLWREGAFQGVNAREAFFVRCGLDTTSPAEIERGRVHLQVGFAPLKPAEFVVLRLEIRTGGRPPADSGLAAALQQVLAAAADLAGDASGKLGQGGPALLALFSGPSGTGKTAAARHLARRLRRTLYRVDADELTHGYIGETEKNLARLFATAEERDAVLLFDEADALFGRRTGLRAADDRYANIEVSHLLRRLGEFGGLVVLSTERVEEIDPAFAGRCRFRLRFSGPRDS